VVAVLSGFWLTVFKQKWGRAIRSDNASFVKPLSSFVQGDCDLVCVALGARKGCSVFELFNHCNSFAQCTSEITLGKKLNDFLGEIKFIKLQCLCGTFYS
jgi:hypothetical protein